MAELENLLLETCQPDSQRIANATKTLKEQVYTQKDCLPALIQLLQQSQSPQVRQLAAVEARKQTTTHWEALNETLKQQIRESLLQSTQQEPEKLVRHSSARVIAAIAKVDLPAQKWMDLPNFLVSASTSSKASDRAIGVYILYTLFDSLSEMFANKMHDLFVLFSNTIQDPESAEVRATTLLAIGRMSEIIDSEDKASVKQFRQILPSMVKVLRETIDNDDSENAKQAFEVFQTLLILEPVLISKHIGELVEFMVQLASSQEVDDEYRVMALNFVLTTCRYRKKKIQGLKMGPNLTLAMLQIGTEVHDADDEEDSPARMAYRVMDVLSTALPTSHVYEPLLSAAGQMLQSSDPMHRKSALTCMGVAVEGAVDFVSSHFDQILPRVVHGLKDPDAIVQRAALLALGQIADELPTEIAERHAELLPLVFDLMHSQGEAVGKSATNALDALLEGLEKEDILGYLPRLMSSFFTILQQQNVEIEVKTTVVAAIGSAAHSSSEEFTPYFQQTMQLLTPYLNLHESEVEMDFRGVVTDTIGTIAAAVGKEQFNPYVQSCVQAAYGGLESGHSRLRECAFCFFAILARVYEAEFAPFISMVVPQLIKSMEQDEMGGDGNADVVGDAVDGGGSVNIDDIDLTGLDGEEDLDDEDLMKSLGFNSAVAMEKEIAADAVGEIFAHTKADFASYIEPCTAKLVECLDHFYEGVRKAAVSSLFRFVATLYNMSNPEQWLPGLPAPVKLHDDVEQYAAHVRKEIFQVWISEDEKLVCTEICRNLAETIRVCGPAIIGNEEDLKKVCELTLSILQKQHPCQTDDGLGGFAGAEDEDDAVELDDDESAELDAMLIDAAADVLISLAFALQEQFVESFNIFMPELVKFYNSKSVTERAMTVAALGEISGGLKASVTPFTEKMFEVLMRGLNDSDSEVRSNSSYATGLLCEFSKTDLSSEYMNILQKLQPLFSGTNHRNAKDNAVGCTARMIIARPHAVPLAQVLPVLVSQLPLKQDYAENAPVYKMITQLYRANNSNIMELTEQLVPVFAHVLAPPEDQLKEENRRELLELVKALAQQFPEIRGSALGQYC